MRPQAQATCIAMVNRLHIAISSGSCVLRNVGGRTACVQSVWRACASRIQRSPQSASREIRIRAEFQQVKGAFKTVNTWQHMFSFVHTSSIRSGVIEILQTYLPLIAGGRSGLPPLGE